MTARTHSKGPVNTCDCLYSYAGGLSQNLLSCLQWPTDLVVGTI